MHRETWPDLTSLKDLAMGSPHLNIRQETQTPKQMMKEEPI
jgi:hypothetical protein